MTAAALSGILAAWLLAIASPGPDLVQILRLGAVRRTGVACALGIMSGNTLWIIASMVGLSALVVAAPWVLTVLYTVGGSFLLWMGLGALRAGLVERRSAGTTVPAGAPAASSGATSISTATAWRLGLVTNLANPKAVVFFGAVFAGFVPPDTGWGMRAVVLVGLVVTGVMWFVAVALMVSVPVLSRRLQAAGPWIDIIAGVVFIALGVFLVVEGVLEAAPDVTLSPFQVG